MARRTYYFRVTFFPRHWKQIEDLAPVYDKAQAEAAVQGWWRAGYLVSGNRNATLHFNALVSTEDIEEFYANNPEIDLKLRPRAQRPKWMLVEMEPHAIDASGRAYRRYKKKHPDTELDLDHYRANTLRHLVFDTFGVTP